MQAHQLKKVRVVGDSMKHEDGFTFCLPCFLVALAEVRLETLRGTAASKQSWRDALSWGNQGIDRNRYDLLI